MGILEKLKKIILPDKEEMRERYYIYMANKVGRYGGGVVMVPKPDYPKPKVRKKDG